MAASTRGAGSAVGGRRVTEASFTWPSWPWSSSRTVTESSSGGVGSGSSSTRDSGSTTTSSWTSAATSTGSVTGGDRDALLDDDYDNTSFLDDLLRNDNGSSSSSGSDLFTGLLSNFSGTTASSAANYTTEFSVNVNVSSSVASVAAERSSRLSLGALPDLLEEDELMALWNCTNCFLLNYGSSGGIGAGNGSNGLLNVTRNGTGGWDRDDWMFLRPNGSLSGSDFGSENGSGGGMVFDGEDMETTIYLIRVIVTAVVLGIVILATVIGNVFVIAAILLERNLQSVANHLILSLAVADLLVACLVMPLGAVYEVSKEWRLGADLCDMWTSSDVLCCTASILHLVAIALDRYWAVTDIDYAHQRTARRIGYMIIVIWTLSVLVSIAPLLGWKDPEWEARVYQDLQCIVSQDIGYQIFATASSFYVPLLVILFLYWRIFLAARKRIRRRQQAAQTHPEPLAKASCMALTSIGFRWKVTASQPNNAIGGPTANVVGGSGGIAAAVVAVIGRPLPTISETTTAFTNVSSANTSPEKGSLGNGLERDRIDVDPPTADLSVAYPSGGGCGPGPSSSKPSIAKKKNQSATDSKRERKAAKTLAIITGAFVCCWLPFFIIAILLPTCTACDISPIAMSVCLWLGYFNSTLNPIIYTIFSPEFRHAFKRILCGRKHSLRRARNVRHLR
ncbi:5-hydroxytryptamine receptor isoform X2 [Culex quinquefasciatus]|uniref:5-hydroxytryptamine receptor isoform X2 n=1 Tax=Culex quinquefasciatus TaxID=7176 RepID=UPI0018E3D77D|nr:5-hydroxytryptamine receptor isoform X2 [Culex quinquefasciatus]